MSDSLSLDEAVEKARETVEKGGAVRFSGRCGVGKTHLCEEILEKYKEEVLKGAAFMVAPWSREAADILSDKVLSKLLTHETGVYATDPRPVKTPAALAFALLKKNNDNIRLLDVSDQTKLISEVIQKIVEQVSAGNESDLDGICTKLREYIQSDSSQLEVGATTASRFEKVFLAPRFITKLREIFARFSELGIGLDDKDIVGFEDNLKDLELKEDRRQHACLSWEIVQDLRSRYVASIKENYPNYYDNSYMLLECKKKVESGDMEGNLPKLIVVDDCQDLNLATFDLLQSLHLRGVPLVFIGNDDESVQNYKGAFPDVLSILETENFEGPYLLKNDDVPESKFLQDTANNIGSWFLETPIKKEASRTTKWDAPLGSFKCAVTKSEEEEIALLKNEILSCKIEEKTEWGDLAVVANDNAFLKRIGEDLDRNGIPFKYTAVNDQSIKNSPIIKGMLALMQLAYYASGQESVQNMRQNAFSLAVAALQSPLFENTKTAQIFIDKNIFQAVLSSLASAQKQDSSQPENIFEKFSAFKKWLEWSEVAEKDKNLEAFFAFLLIHPSDRGAVFKTLEADGEKKNNFQAFETLFELLDKAKDISSVPELFCNLWEGCGLRYKWQDRALKGGAKSAEVNEWLDQLIRLQDLADTGKEGESIPNFLKRVSNSYIESDSLAQVAPKDDRITLSSPSGLQSKRYKKVWVADVQEKVWDKYVIEELFATHLLEAVATKDRVEKTAPGFLPKDVREVRDRFEVEEKYSNWRNFLVASSRSDGETVFLAVSDQEHAPFYGVNSLIATGGACPFFPNGQSELELGRLTTDGMAAYCRSKLAKAILEGNAETADDAANALRMLMRAGVEKADPKSWNFAHAAKPEDSNEDSGEEICLKPSGVDGIWNTPVRQTLQNNEGPTKSKSQMQFGTAIHTCAQWATEEGKDRSESEEQLKEELLKHFEELQDEQADLSNLDRGSYERKARKAMANLAIYFATTCDPEKSEACPSKLKDVPPLEKAFAEQRLEANFTIENIYEMAKRSDAFKDMDFTEDEFIEAMEILGNFDGLESVKGKRIYLTGKIDRLERREGGKTYVIDYKTGSSYCNSIKDVSDLQLFCYQLLLYFNKSSETKKKYGDRAARSMLFSVEKEPYPASSKDTTSANKGDYNYEHYYQPCIFDISGTKFNETPIERKKLQWNSIPITGHMPKGIENSLNPIIRALHIPPAKKKSEDDLETWLPWVFYMFAKFFYAVRYVDALQIQMREIDEEDSDQHLIEKAMTIYGMAEKASGTKEDCDE